LDFVAPDFDFVAVGFDFVAAGFAIVVVGLEIVVRGPAKLVSHVKQLAGPAAKLPLARQDLRPVCTPPRPQIWPP
jgi:hypothetical protein